MSTLTVPVLLFPSPPGLWTALAVAPRFDHAAVATTRAAALRQLEDSLARRARSQDPPVAWFAETAERMRFRVDLELSDQAEGLPWFEASALPLQVDAVVGAAADGHGIVCALPWLGLAFGARRREHLKRTVTSQVLAVCARAPDALAHALSPDGLELHHVRLFLAPRTAPGAGAAPTPALDAAAQPWQEVAKNSALRVALERDADHALGNLRDRLRTPQPCVVLVGAEGVGRTTLLLDALSRRTNDDTGQRPRPVFLTSAARIVAGQCYLGQWEARCEALLAELRDLGGMLWLESLVEPLRVGGGGPRESVAAFLLPYVQRRELALLTEATPDELAAARRLLPEWADAFDTIRVEPLDRNRAVQAQARILSGLRPRGVTDAVRETAATLVRLHQRFQPYEPLPGRASGLAHELCRAGTITTDDAIRSFAARTGLPEVILRQDAGLDAARLHGFFGARVLGQPAAVRTATDVVLTFKAGLHDPERPPGTLLFCGPTGVGKTETAKALGEFLFGHRPEAERLVRLDLSEYGLPGAAHRFLVAANGEPAPWLDRLRRNPFAVVLLDEIEKAAPEIHDILLSALDEGRVVDRFGRITWLRSALVVMTSNLGARSGPRSGFAGSTAPDYGNAVARFFRPEFRNRIDDIVVFEPLGAAVIHAITRKELAALVRREGLVRRGLRLHHGEDLVDWLARVGFDPELGARPLQRAIETHVVSAVARFLSRTPAAAGTGLELTLGPDGQVSVRRRD